MNVLFVGEVGDNPCRYYRCELPALGLTELGHNVIVDSLLVETDAGYLTTRNVYGVPAVIVCRMMLGPNRQPISSAPLFRRARAAGQRVFMDLDDDVWHLPEWNPARSNITAETLAVWVEDANASNGVIVSTPELANIVRPKVDVPVLVCENGIDVRDYEPSYVEHDPLRLGWVGVQAFRYPDVETVLPNVQEMLGRVYVERLVKERKGDVEFWHLGTRPDDIHSIAANSRPWVPLAELPRQLRDIDVAIVPSLHVPFNDARSPTTGLALCAAGIPFVATPTPAYRRLWNSGAGYLADSPEEWDAALRVLTEPEYRDARDSMRTYGLTVARNRNPQWVARQYLQVFENGAK